MHSSDFGRNNRTWFAVALFLVAIAGCGDEGNTTQNSTNLFPALNKTGNYWVFDVYDVDTLGNVANQPSATDSCYIAGTRYLVYSQNALPMYVVDRYNRNASLLQSDTVVLLEEDNHVGCYFYHRALFGEISMGRDIRLAPSAISTIGDYNNFARLFSPTAVHNPSTIGNYPSQSNPAVVFAAPQELGFDYRFNLTYISHQRDTTLDLGKGNTEGYIINCQPLYQAHSYNSNGSIISNDTAYSIGGELRIVLNKEKFIVGTTRMPYRFMRRPQGATHQIGVAQKGERRILRRSNLL